jgi:hypothetical protein
MQFDTIILDELSPDSSDYEHDGLEQATNAIPVQSAWREIKGRVVQSNQDIGADLPLRSFGDGATIYFATSGRLYTVEPNLDWVWTDRSKGGVSYGVVSSWNFTKFGTTVIAAPAAGVTQKRIGAAAAFSDLMTSVDRPRPSLVGVVRSVVLGARLEAAGTGFYAGTADLQQFCWSARNDATNWQVDGLNGAGFGFLKAADGDINAMVCFNSFALIFKSFGVYRLDYTGDANGFVPAEIGNGGLGMANPEWGPSAVKAGGDVFYLSDLGPCVVYNGETCQLLGGSKVRRYFSDMLSDYGALTGSVVEGTYDPYLGLVVWTIKPHKNADTNERILVVTEIKHGSYDAYTVRFSPQEGRWATIEPGFVTTNICHNSDVGLASFPLDRMVMFEYVAPSTMKAVNFQDASTSLPITLVSKIWHPVPANGAPPGSRQALLHGVRPIWGVDLNGGALPEVTVLVDWSNDPLMKSGVASLTLSMSTHDDDWFLSKANMPVVAGYFRFTVTIPSMGNAHLREFHALELAFMPSAEG